MAVNVCTAQYDAMGSSLLTGQSYPWLLWSSPNRKYLRSLSEWARTRQGCTREKFDQNIRKENRDQPVTSRGKEGR